MRACFVLEGKQRFLSTAASRSPRYLQERGAQHCKPRGGCCEAGLGRRGRGAACPAGTLCPEGLAAEVALEGLLAGVRAQVHVEVGFLREGVVAELTNVGALVPAGRGHAAEPPRGRPQLENGHLDPCLWSLKLAVTSKHCN